MKLILENIQKSFGSQKVLKGVHYTFEEGKIYGLLGRNGAGKTTLFKVLYDELEAEEGHVYIEEDGARHPLKPSEVGMLFSEPILPEYLTGFEFTRFFMDVHGLDVTKAKDELAKMDFSEADQNKFIKDYSTGMKAKLSLMSLMLASPKVLLLDEPLTSLDVVMASKMKALLREFRQGRILIFSTHVMEVARDLCEEIVLLRGGKTSHFVPKRDFEEELIRHLMEDEAEAVHA
ncbi:MAG TPA: ATP-binding cassette domain-containing protein [Tissierellia bacterium]|nr:ATP-binding cassette domain-containing protein [Tissierellia bacterium]